jgi:galactokinase
MESFEARFGSTPDAVARAPGRVNLLGEHTDYNEGYVLPAAIPQTTTVALRVSLQAFTTVYSEDIGEAASFAPGAAPQARFARYVYGCIEELKAHGTRMPSFDIYVRSDVPIGVGVSSSAALEVATLRALRAALQVPLDDVTLARLAQRAEIRHAGVNCGILDQMASSLLDSGSMLFLDTRSLEYRLMPLPREAELVALDSGVRRALADTKYNERRSECEEAARQLGAPSLRDVHDLGAVDQLREPLRKRARHVIRENARVLDATGGASGMTRAVSAEAFGRLMNESHASLRDDYEVSIPALDRLAALLQRDPDVYGAKLTGAGFGGACVALCRQGTSAACARRVLTAYAREGGRGALIVPAGQTVHTSFQE